MSEPMLEEVLHQRGTTLVRRLRLEPGEAMRWHRDPFHRVSVILSGDQLAIEYRNRSTRYFGLAPGQVDWEEPSDHIHRAVNVGQQAYEEITIFFLNSDADMPQPRCEDP